MRLLGVRPNQSEPGSVAVLQRYEAGEYAGCMALAVEPQRADATEIIGTVRGRGKPLRFGSSSNRYADDVLHRICLLLAQRGHADKRIRGRYWL
jgi:hypothetical protein